MTTINGGLTTGVEFKNPLDTLEKAKSAKFELNPVIYANEPDTVELSGKKIDKKTVAKGAAILAAAAAVTAGVVLAAKSGKFAKIGKVLQGLKPKQNLSLEEFKKNGSFEGGIAKIKNKLFTGTITVSGKEGGVTTLTYDKGKITESFMQGAKKEGELTPYVLKQYSYAADGAKTITKTIGEGAYPDKGAGTIFNAGTTKIFPDKTNVRTVNEKIFKDGHYSHTQTTHSGTIFIDGQPKNVIVGSKEVNPGTPFIDYTYKVTDTKTGEEIVDPNELHTILNELRERSDVFKNPLGL